MVMEERELISAIRAMRNIKPGKDWVFLLKNQVLFPESPSHNPVQRSSWRETLPAVWGVLSGRAVGRGFAYAFSVCLVVLMGILGFAQFTLPGDMLFPVRKIAEQSQASLARESNLQSNLENFKKRSYDLTQAVKGKKAGNISSAVKEVNEAAKQLIQLAEDPKAAKEIAKEIKNSQVLLYLEGTPSAKEASPALYEACKVLVEQMLLDLEKTTLTESQQAVVDEAKSRYAQGEYFQALEKILMVNS